MTKCRPVSHTLKTPPTLALALLRMLRRCTAAPSGATFFVYVPETSTWKEKMGSPMVNKQKLSHLLLRDLRHSQGSIPNHQLAHLRHVKLVAIWGACWAGMQAVVDADSQTSVCAHAACSSPSRAYTRQAEERPLYSCAARRWLRTRFFTDAESNIRNIPSPRRSRQRWRHPRSESRCSCCHQSRR